MQIFIYLRDLFLLKINISNICFTYIYQIKFELEFYCLLEYLKCKFKLFHYKTY